MVQRGTRWLLAACLALAARGGAAPTAAAAAQCVEGSAGGALLVRVCADPATGWLTEISAATGPAPAVVFPLLAGSGSALLGCSTASVSVSSSAQSLVINRTVVCTPNFYHNVSGARAAVVDTLRPSSHNNNGNNSSSGDWAVLDWETVVTSQSPAMWSTAVVSALAFESFGASARAWVGGPASDQLPNASFSPIAPFPVTADTPKLASFWYGTKQTDINHPQQINHPSMQLPIVSRLDASAGGADGLGMSLVQSPADTPVVAFASVVPVGSGGVALNVTREYHRLGREQTGPLVFRQHLVAHAACWRPAVGFLRNAYPQFFAAHPSVNLTEIEGTGSYADLRGPADIGAADRDHYARMGYRLNWDSSARFPWHGEWIPTAADGFNESWLTCFQHDAPDGHQHEGCRTASYAGICGWYANQRHLGFRTCQYGNLFEFGWDVAANWPTTKLDCGHPTSNASTLACHTRRLLEEKYGQSLIWQTRSPSELLCGGMMGSCIMDPDPSGRYLAHLLDMANTSMDRVPSAGVCIDRQDFVGHVNPAGDDGQTWYPTVPGKQFQRVRAMVFSWKAAMAEFAATWHARGKAVIINDHCNRLDMMQHVDGIYAEMGDISGDGFAHGVGSALAALEKPVILWNHPKPSSYPVAQIETALQGHLYLGVYPTVPVRNNDHAIGGGCAPNCPYDGVYEAYGPLFDMLRGKRWVLSPHAVWLEEPDAGQANVFFVTAGVVAPIVQCPLPRVTVRLRVPGLAGVDSAFALFPSGSRGVANCTAGESAGEARCSVDVRRSMALLVFPVRETGP